MLLLLGLENTVIIRRMEQSSVGGQVTHARVHRVRAVNLDLVDGCTSDTHHGHVDGLNAHALVCLCIPFCSNAHRQVEIGQYQRVSSRRLQNPSIQSNRILEKIYGDYYGKVLRNKESA